MNNGSATDNRGDDNDEMSPHRTKITEAGELIVNKANKSFNCT